MKRTARLAEAVEEEKNLEEEEEGFEQNGQKLCLGRELRRGGERFTRDT